ncbi:ATP-dependent DNA/RNA helicase DHX36 isoform X2 [Xenopus laevis]|uniref:ATP-dependent DNA/RNA helicase DHX36 n=1 Tax=Xenopus laevis TaxID=8355 RepID=A0A8J1KVS1_XENLA|nr:ATP-dependent DNA/RNA helicase DHX36 isoform X2 [Xenopus laevis]
MRAVVKMDESREKHIARLLNSVQAQNNNERSSCSKGSWWATENERNNVSPQLRQPASSEVKDHDWDSEYAAEENEAGTYLDQQLREEMQKKRTNYKYLEMQTFREKLPSYGMKEMIIKMINSNQVTVISGETGCGKTTQVTQFILDDHINRGKGSSCYIVCTQPRRISAISVAERVAAERGETCGRENSTGYQIRLESQMPRRQGSILYCTTGIVIQWLQSDPHLANVSHIVIDEIHERNLQSDVLMAIVKDLLTLRSDLKVILMSATLNAEKFSQYFENCPMLHIPGFTYPVKEYLLEDVIEMVRYMPKDSDRRPRWKKRFMQGRMIRPEKEQKEELYRERWPDFVRKLQTKYSQSTIEALETADDEKVDLDLIVELIRFIVLKGEDGAILVFLPGWDNISTLHDLLMSQVMFKSDKFIIIPLHSLMPTVNQKEVFKRPPPGVRKIVIATNIAETSITIDDVVHVIDGGKIKETHYDTQNNISTMTAEWVSHANAKQRKGRAGRVQPGHCYHLYNSLRDSLLDDYQLPEIVRMPLEELCLQIKILKLGGIGSFLSKLMDIPSREAICLAINHLMELNALDNHEELTPLGFHLARLPVEPHIGKMILFGALFCCLDPVLTIAASLSFKDPFVIPLGKEKMADARRKELSRNLKSDHLTVLNAFEGWEYAKWRGARAERDYCWENFLSSNTLKMLSNMKGQFAEHLLNAGFVSSRNPNDPKSNNNSNNEKLIKAVICAGLYPKVAKIRQSLSKKRKMVKVYTKSDGKVNIHPKSVNVEETEFHYSWLVYHLKMRTSSKRIALLPDVKTFMQGVSHLAPPVRAPAPLWDLTLVLRALQDPPFEPLGSVPLLWLTWKTTFLLAIASARRVSELSALSCKPPFLVFHHDRAVLCTIPSFLPKVVSDFHLNQEITIPTFCPSHSNPKEKALHTLDPVRALKFYLHRVQDFRKVDSLLVIPSGPHQGGAATKSSISRWIKQAIHRAYVARGRTPPARLTAHSTRGMSTSWAFRNQASAEQLCKAATWTSVHSFSKFYHFDTFAASDTRFGRRVLQAAVVTST